MTTAHRPTFDPARGKEAQRGPAYHQRLLPAHKTLKFRQQNQGTAEETEQRDLRSELLRAERKYYAKKKGIEYHSDDEDENSKTPQQRIEGSSTTTEERGVKRDADTLTEQSGPGESGAEESYEAKRARVLEETRRIDASSSESENDDNDDGEKSSSEDEDDDEDEEAALMAELAKIKKERADVAAKEAAEKARKDEEQREVDIATGNPLLSTRSEDYGVKRRWDDDVVFKNQARGTSDKNKDKAFVNDLLRSDFHRKFMSKYVR